MTNIKSRHRARIEIIETLKAAGLLEGISLRAEQLQNATKPCFWHGVVRNDKAKTKDCYVTWFIPRSQAATRADDKTLLREVVIAVDVFAKRSFDSEQNHKLLEALENAFAEKGYEVEFGEEQFEEKTGLFHYPLTMFKLF
jgi:hypothetical protein